MRTILKSDKISNPNRIQIRTKFKSEQISKSEQCSNQNKIQIRTKIETEQFSKLNNFQI